MEKRTKNWDGEKVTYRMVDKYFKNMKLTATTFNIVIDYENLSLEFKNFSRWLINSFEEDFDYVTTKNMKYIIDNYKELSPHISKLNYENYRQAIRCIERDYNYCKDFKDYLSNTKDSYYDVKDNDEDEYLLYDYLSSWYENRSELTDSIIKNISYKICKDLKEEADDKFDDNKEIVYTYQNQKISAIQNGEKLKWELR